MKINDTPQVPGYACTIDELMVVTFSRALKPDTRAFNGAVSFIPACGFMLARATHAPELVWAAGSIGIDASPTAIPESTLSDGIWQGSTMLANSPFDFWAHAQGARYNTFSFRGAQIDKFGNVNNSVIGQYESPKVRLAGGGGMADLSVMIPRIMLWSTTHTPRTFVDRVDFRSGLGYGDGGDDRQRRGIAGGPVVCVTNLCVFGFHPVTKQMQIETLHPGVSRSDVESATGFNLDSSEKVPPRTARPSDEEIRLLREVIDPGGARKREFA